MSASTFLTAIAFALLAVRAMAGITLYEDFNLQGQSLLTSHDISNLHYSGFNDKASSIIVPYGETWMLYQHAYYGGQVSIKGRGHHRTPAEMGLPNDSLSSLRRIPDFGGPLILLFLHSNYNGRMVAIRGNNVNLQHISFNDAVSSIIIVRGTWILYKHANFAGTAWTAGPGYYSYPWWFENDAISSVKLH